MVTTVPSPLGASQAPQTFAAKTPADYPAFGVLVEEFDLWQPDYQGALVHIFRAGTSEYAPIFGAQDLTGGELTNPQVLMTFTDDLGQQYGKFTQSIYTPYAYSLHIDSKHDTGTQRVPVYELDGEDASFALVTSTGGSQERTLRDRAADFVWAEDYGLIGDSAVVNTATITAAIAAVVNGTVRLPAGDIPFTTITFGDEVVIEGAGDGVTTLTSASGNEIVTITGDSSGFRNLTLDGVNLTTDSVGIYSENVTNFILDHVTVKRFETNLYHKGGIHHKYRMLNLENGGTQAKFHGDGAPFYGLDWVGGHVTISTANGLELKVIDDAVYNNHIDVDAYEDNIGTAAVYLYGAQDTFLSQPEWRGNTINIYAKDNPDTMLADRQCFGFHLEGGTINDGALRFDGLCQDFLFERVTFGTVTITLSTPEDQIIAKDCVEVDVTLAGDTTKWMRVRQASNGSVFAQTSDATVTTVCKIPLEQNEVRVITVSATAEQTNGTGYAAWIQSRGFRCAPGTLKYDGQTQNFTVGDLITGSVSAATAYIVADSDGGTTGTLSLGGIGGTFVDNETITGATTGSALVNGVMALGDAAAFGAAVVDTLSTGSNTNDPPSGWDLTFAVSEQEVLVQVTGASATNVNWNVAVDVKY